ncbi:IS3 family transposase [Palleronia caenipelagi]|uniref:IS3 family transposase n=1 Tax=Palleronia caenipelagi TaxID=2489174 RepID=A0A547PJR8_9RHOB|nr:IS3 family transposase [Palleronia caenipelagi]TRD14405.1 IS3 family transposase [Palleronia caenipelagi]
MENFFASLKKKLVHCQRFTSHTSAKVAIFEYIGVFYNRQRRHTAAGDQTPAEAFTGMIWKMAA